eukprot:5740195-Pyramimonas_sp.AAC.1
MHLTSHTHLPEGVELGGDSRVPSAIVLAGSLGTSSNILNIGRAPCLPRRPGSGAPPALSARGRRRGTSSRRAHRSELEEEQTASLSRR